ncbi:MAG: Fibronectin type protein [Candidatus Saccharibacteria bacterium]|nr:Fibronectin type protein [Candidatus Saccharibacteria bacterium]
MINKIRHSAQWVFPVMIGMLLLALFVFIKPTSAISQIPIPDPKPGSYGLEATKLQAPPTDAATITTPGNGASFTTSPTAVTGICTTGLLVQVYDNGVMAGSVICASGSFTMQISLFAGTNELSAIVYDDLEQAGPTSNIATVTYTDTHFTAFGALVTLTSSYGRRSAPAGSELSWPLQLSGGAGPYAFSIDWGDGTPSELKSQSLAGLITIAHTYKKAGIYQVNIKVTDVNGVSAFLQVVAVSSGQVDSTAAPTDKTNTAAATKILWIPAVVALVLLAPTYWLGRRSQIVSLRNKMLKERDSLEEK